MNALSVKSTAATGQANAGTTLDATLTADPAQYDGVLHAGGPDRTAWTIWDLGAAYDITNVDYDFSGTAGYGYADFSTDGTAWGGRVGPFGTGATGAGQAPQAGDGGGPLAHARYVRFYPANPTGDWATCETFVYVAGGRVGGPAAPADTAPPVPLSAAVNAAGTGGTLNWTEAGSPPVLQAAGQGPSQGLTLTASGGAVALSAVATAGTQTSFTTGRTIGQGEALSLAGAAGAFTDSAAAPNPNAAFAGLAVANASAASPPGAPDAPAFAAIFPTAVVVITSPLPSGAASLNLQRAPNVGGAPGAWATPADGAGVTPSSAAVDTGLTPSTGYFYRFVAVGPGGSTNGPASPLVITGANPMSGVIVPRPTYTATGVLSKYGIALELTPGEARKAARLLERVEGNLTAVHSMIKRKATHNHPGTVGSVRGTSKTSGTPSLEITPESMDEIYALFFGAPVNAAASSASTLLLPAGVPQAPVGIAISQIGAAGAANGSYTVIACNAQGDSVASAAVVTNTANAALSVTNYSQLTWTPVLTATFYKILKGGQLVGISQYPFFNDQGQVTSAYVAPAAAAGYVNTYLLGLARLTATIAERRGDSVFLYGGVSGQKLSLKWDKNQTDALTAAVDLEALYELVNYTEAQLGLDTAGTDPLGAIGVAPNVQTMIAGYLADASTWGVDVDGAIGEKQTLSGFTGPSGHYRKGTAHSVTSTVYFSTDAELQRYLGQLPQPQTGPYGLSKNVNYFPASITTALPVNSAGIINELRLLMPNCNYETVGQAYRGKDAIMQDLALYPNIDLNTGCDIILQTISSRTGIGTASTAIVQPVPSQAQFNYTA